MAKLNRFRRARRRKPVRRPRVSTTANYAPPAMIWEEQARAASRVIKDTLRDAPFEEQFVAPATLGTYAEAVISPDARAQHAATMAKVEQLLAQDPQSAYRSALTWDFEAYANTLELTEAEGASLLNVEPGVWSSDGRLTQFNAETAWRILHVTETVGYVMSTRGFDVAPNWLREPEQNPKLVGITPIQELAHQDALRLIYFRIYVKDIYLGGWLANSKEEMKITVPDDDDTDESG